MKPGSRLSVLSAVIKSEYVNFSVREIKLHSQVEINNNKVRMEEARLILVCIQVNTHSTFRDTFQALDITDVNK